MFFWYTQSMATSYPTSIDNGTNLPNPVSTDTLASIPHSTLHTNVNDAIKAIETKLGTGTTITSLGTVTTGIWNGTAIAAANGGTGQTSYAIGDILYASTSSALSKLADVATGNALISGGIGVAPSWGKVALTTHISGILPVANGGTNQTGTITTVAPVVTTTPLALATNYKVQFTPNATVALTTTVPAAGVECTLIVLTSGVTAYTLTFSTGFVSQGTLSTGTVTGKYFIFKFISNGTNLLEISRTLAM